MEILNSIDPFLIIYAFCSVAISFIIKGIAGFGDPLLFNPLLSIYYNSTQISPAMIPSGLASNIIMAIKNRKLILDLITFDVILLALISIPAMLGGMWLGGKIDKKLPDKTSRKFINYIFLIGGISTIVYAVLGMVE